MLLYASETFYFDLLRFYPVILMDTCFRILTYSQYSGVGLSFRLTYISVSVKIFHRNAVLFTIKYVSHGWSAQ